MTLIEQVLTKHGGNTAAAILELAAIRDKQLQAVEVATVAAHRINGAIEVLEAMSSMKAPKES